MNEESKRMKQLFTSIANAIREVSGYEGKIVPTDFPELIRNIKIKGLAKNIRKENLQNYIYGIQVANVAKSYYNARKLGVEFKYTKSHSCLSDGVLTDENGYCLMDCSTFIGLVLRGIEYADSPYKSVAGQKNMTLGSLNKDLDYIPNLAKTSKYQWALTSLDKQKGEDYNNLKVHGYRSIRNAAQIAEYFYQCGQVLYEYPTKIPFDLMPGDLVFWSKPKASEEQKKRFRGISHIGVIGRDANTVIHVTGSEEQKGNTVFYAKLTTQFEHVTFIIRPNYASRFIETPFNTNIIPTHYFSENVTVEELEKIENNITIKQRIEGGFTINRTQVGEDDNYYWLVSDSYNLELTKGKYYLSGCGVCESAKPDENVRDYGLFIYYGGTNEPVLDINGKEVNDKGQGCYFDINEPTKVKICLYCNRALLFDNIVMKPSLIRYS